MRAAPLKAVALAAPLALAVACSAAPATSPGSASASGSGLVTASAAPSGPAGSSTAPTSATATATYPVITPWPAPTASPEIAAAQAQLGSVGKTLLTWVTAAGPIGVSLDYITDYRPAAGYVVPKGQRAVQFDVRVVNASTAAVNLAGWSIYADVNNKPLTAVKDANFIDISTLAPVAPNSNGYLPARVLIPTAGATILIGVTNPAFPNQPASFAVTLS